MYNISNVENYIDNLNILMRLFKVKLNPFYQKCQKEFKCLLHSKLISSASLSD